MTSTFRSGGDPLGTHRVIHPRGLLPQAAERLDPSLPAYEGEIVLEVDVLNVDAASFVQLESTGQDVGQQVLEIVEQRGKMQNPVTGSGGMLLGRVKAIGPKYLGPLKDLQPGDKVATLVSLTLTPLYLDHVIAVHPHAHQLVVQGHAILSSSAPAAAIPGDLHPTLVLSALDVCGAPAQVDRLVEKLPQNANLLVIGAGKAGVLSLAAARKARPDLRLVALDRVEGPLREAAAAGLCDGWQAVDASDALAVRQAVQDLTAGEMAHAVVNMASLPGTEMATILACRPRGTCLFFGMATSFPRVALGAEGVGADVDLLIGNGYVTGHAAFTLDLVRALPNVRQLLEKRLGL